MNKFIKYKFVLILLFTFLLFNGSLLIINIYVNKDLNKDYQFKDKDISFIVYFKNLTKNKHSLFYPVMKAINSTRNFYFINSEELFLNPNITSLVENSTVKVVQSNLPDSFYLPFVISLYGNKIPELILFIEGDELKDNCYNSLIKWIYDTYENLIKNHYDYIFGNSQIVNGDKIGCSLLIINATIIEHLLYYTDSDISHINPFIQLSLATKTKFGFIQFDFVTKSKLINIYSKFSLNMNCPIINDKENPSLCIILPNFKRNYLNLSFTAFSNQTYKPNFYLIIQNDNRLYYNISSIQKIVDRPIYHIWMQNWNSFFFLNHRIASILPCDFVLKYDDDQWPNDYQLQEKLINIAKGKNVIIGYRGFALQKPYCGYLPNNYTKLENNTVDHAAVPILMRPFYIKLEARNNVYRLFGGEDIALCLNSYKLCNVSAKLFNMQLVERQFDGNNQRGDKQIIDVFKKENDTNFNLFRNIYCYYIRSGYIPRTWSGFRVPIKDELNITIMHKALN